VAEESSIMYNTGANGLPSIPRVAGFISWAPSLWVENAARVESAGPYIEMIGYYPRTYRGGFHGRRFD
jgi:hypothetical protein